MMILKTKNSKIAIIITAAGSSSRMGGLKKEYLHYKNGTVLSNCAKFFLETCKDFEITDFIVTCPQNKKLECEKALFLDKELFLQKNKISIVEGGKSRQKSVFNALCAIKNLPEIVLIHDGARPFVTKKIILDGIENAFLYQASVPGITPTDTQKRIDKNGFIIEHLDRNSLVAVQTPQCFNFEKLYLAHKKAISQNLEFTDDTAIWGEFYKDFPVKVFTGDSKNIKITYPQDLKNLENGEK